MSALSPQDRRWLDSAVRLARTRLGKTGPFPPAAAIVVDAPNQLLAGRGVTGAMGRPSAVVAALADARGRSHGCTAYLTMEPEASSDPGDSEVSRLLEAGISRAVLGTIDPAKSQRGRAARALGESGVDVILAEHAPARLLIEGYAMRVGRGRPFVSVILAVSADGMIAGRDGESVDLLSPVAHRWRAFQRATADAVVTSERTLERGNGTLPRRDGESGRAGPLLVVVSGRPGGRVHFAEDGGRILQIVPGDETEGGDDDDHVRLPGRNGRIDLSAMMSRLADRGINAVQVDAGARLTEALVSAELVDRVQLLESMAVIGRGGLPATPLGALDARLRAAGFEERGERLVGDNRLRTFERQS